MPPLVIPNTLQVVVNGNLAGGEVWANVWHVANPLGVTITQSDANAIGAIFRAFYDTTGGIRGTGWSMAEITVRDLNAPGENVYTADALPKVGTNGAQMLPYECAVVITLHTLLNTRRGRGRSFQNGLVINQVAANAGGAPIVLATAVTSIRTAMITLLEDLVTADFPLGVASRADLVTRPVVSGYIDNGWDTQRGRSDDIATTRNFFP